MCQPCLSKAVWQDPYDLMKGVEVYLFVIAGQSLVVRFRCLLQSLVFCRLPHHGASPPGRYLPGAMCPQNPQIATAPVSEQPTHLVSWSVSLPGGPRCRREDKYSILHVSHSSVALFQTIWHNISHQFSQQFCCCIPPALPHPLSSSFRLSQQSMKMAGQWIPHFHTVTGLRSLTDLSIKNTGAHQLSDFRNEFF